MEGDGGWAGRREKGTTLNIAARARLSGEGELSIKA